MACNEEELSAYLDGELASAAKASYADHIQHCACCGQKVQALTHVSQVVKTEAMTFKAPNHLRYRILADLEALKKTNKKARPVERSWLWINFGLSSLCSIALVITMTMYLSMPTQAESVRLELVASHYRSLLANHLSDVASSDQHTVKPWFTGKLDYAPVVHDFANEGFVLLGGRLDYINKRTVAALTYRHNSHVINVFMWPDQTGRSPTKTSVQGFHVVEWDSGGMAYSIVSDMNAEEMMTLRNLIVSEAD